jgi:Flp pilus assembly protein TadB
MMSRRERHTLRRIERRESATDPQLAELMSGRQPDRGQQPGLVIALIVLAAGLVVLSLVFTAVALVLAAAVVTVLAAVVQFRRVRPMLRTSRM